jgi:hypothetical protein
MLMIVPVTTSPLHNNSRFTERAEIPQRLREHLALSLGAL